jgi:hypothetical protein
VTYTIEISPEAGEQIRALPPELPKQLAEVMAMLELTPWHSLPINDENPDGAVRQLTFGDAGQVLLTFLILEQQRQVDVLEVLWIE